jgi:hypothetical protein
MTRRIAFATVFIALVTPITAIAYTQNGQQMMRNWATSDKCAAQAQKAFPDFTPESNAKRDAQMKNCLSGNIVPPRGDLEKPAPQP